MAKDHWALPENCEKVAVVPNQTGASIGAGVYIGGRHLRKGFFVVDFVYGADVDCVITVLEAPLVNGTNAETVTKTLPMWASTDTTASSVIPEITAAANYTFDAGDGKNQTLIIQFDPGDFSENATTGALNNAVTVSVGDSDAANLISVDFYMVPREYKKSVLVD
mgnify:CR=1 FL=1